MECPNCGNAEAYHMRFHAGGCCCDRCGKLSQTYIPDVHFIRPYLDPHLVDPAKPEQKNGVWIESRREKAEIMRRLGWREAGDKKGGCRIEDKAAMRRESERFK